MHFSIPLFKVILDSDNISHTIYEIHGNGIRYCSARYSSLRELYEKLLKEFGAESFPNFPPKKLFSLSVEQTKIRQQQLAHFFQELTKFPHIVRSSTFLSFLNEQRKANEVLKVSQPVSLDVYLLNGAKVAIDILSHDKSNDVLKSAAAAIELPLELASYFGLFLVRSGKDGQLSLKRPLQNFECPYISLSEEIATNGEESYRIVLRRAYWDASLDDRLFENRVALNLLHVQAVSDLETSVVHASVEDLQQLRRLRKKGFKREFVQFCRTLPGYGFIVFKDCFVDYPKPQTDCVIRIGNRELIIRLLNEEEVAKEAILKIRRIRHWAIVPNEKCKNNFDFDLMIEYLVEKNVFRWFTISSVDVMFISMSLQSIVNEYLGVKQGKSVYANSEDITTPRTAQESTTGDKEAISSQNEAFSGIGDDDL